MAVRPRDTSGFSVASHQSQALCLGTLGVSLLLWPIAVWGFNSPVRFTLGWMAAGVGVWLLVKARERWRLHALEEVVLGGTGSAAADFTPAAIAEVHASFPPEVLANEQYRRLRREVEEPGPDNAGRVRTGWGVVESARVEGDLLVSYEIKTEHGLLADPAKKTRRVNHLAFLLTEEGSGNRWDVKASPGKDRIYGELIKDTLPGAVAPEPPHSVVRDRDDAVSRYADARWMLGVDAQGNELSYSLADNTFPHVLVVGSTGGGKSVWARTMIETLRVQGFTCFISSGKMTDFAAYTGLPGIAMVGTGPAATAVMVRTVRKEMDRRYKFVKNQMNAGEAKKFPDPPILLLIDEWGVTEMEMKSKYKNSRAFTEDIDILLRKARECRIHVVLLSQTLRKTGEGAVPGSWQANLKLTVSLGRPEPETYKSAAFPEVARGEARRVGGMMADKPGRGMVVERETGRVIEFQSYYGWSPGVTQLDAPVDAGGPPTPEVRAVWEKWVPISDSVPNLLPHRGIRAGGPEWSEGELDDVANTPTVRLTEADGAPIPGREKYDPSNPNWVGAGGDGDFAGLDEDED